ncbi:hypothetical protein EDM56_07650 [Brevibacillus fluminis]|uniref:Uncharacterized protein n=1 Tax=Brevibacillus fluminis TaxID=511487 RepID=A0A3M8DSB5_9BACL|nr:hypothetical protein EDM56_07650 [Brevibacillus fluminis]
MSITGIDRSFLVDAFFVQIRIYKILIQYKCNRGSAKKHGVARFSNIKNQRENVDSESAKKREPTDKNTKRKTDISGVGREYNGNRCAKVRRDFGRNN